jgi:AcrR family transcriptional regulator
MPYPAGHRARVKKNIIDSARKLFNRHGFENVSLHQIMSGAGLTHGGFYSYFKSKSDLYSAVLGCFFTDPEWKSCWEGVHVDLSSTDVGPQIVRVSISPAFRGRREFLPYGRATDRRRAERLKGEARLRDRIQSNGKRVPGELLFLPRFLRILRPATIL